MIKTLYKLVRKYWIYLAVVALILIGVSLPHSTLDISVDGTPPTINMSINQGSMSLTITDNLLLVKEDDEPLAILDIKSNVESGNLVESLSESIVKDYDMAIVDLIAITSDATPPDEFKADGRISIVILQVVSSTVKKYTWYKAIALVSGVNPISGQITVVEKAKVVVKSITIALDAGEVTVYASDIAGNRNKHTGFAGDLLNYAGWDITEASTNTSVRERIELGYPIKAGSYIVWLKAPIGYAGLLSFDKKNYTMEKIENGRYKIEIELSEGKHVIALYIAPESEVSETDGGGGGIHIPHDAYLVMYSTIELETPYKPVEDASKRIVRPTTIIFIAIAIALVYLNKKKILKIF